MLIPRSPLSFSNWFASKALMKISASCFLVAICSRVITLSSTRSLIKWWQMLMCLVLLCWIGYFKILIALTLSHYNFITFWLTLYSFNICFIHISCEQLLPAATYSASAVDKETQLCFLLNHEIKLFPIKKHPPEVLFLSSALPTLSASQNHTKEFVSWEYNIP